MSQSNFATTTQWFPTEGTTCKYNITYTYFLTNGTNFESNKFDLYSGGGLYHIIPSLNKYLFTEPAHSNSVANETEIKYRHSYTEYNGLNSLLTKLNPFSAWMLIKILEKMALLKKDKKVRIYLYNILIADLR